MPDAHIEAVCAEANLDDFWGMQECTLKFGSWTYDGNLIDLKFYKKALDDEDFDKSSPVKVCSMKYAFYVVMTLDLCMSCHGATWSCQA